MNNNLYEVTEEAVVMNAPFAVQAYGKERQRTPLGQLSRGKTSRTVRNNMRGIRFNPGAAVGTISALPNVRNSARHATRSVSPPAPLRRGWGGFTVRRASRHARRTHGRRYRSRHTRR